VTKPAISASRTTSRCIASPSASLDKRIFSRSSSATESSATRPASRNCGCGWRHLHCGRRKKIRRASDANRNAASAPKVHRRSEEHPQLRGGSHPRASGVCGGETSTCNPVDGTDECGVSPPALAAGRNK